MVPFDKLCAASGMKRPVAEFYFAKPRRWRFDWAFPDERVAVEVEGGVWTGGRHTRGAGFLKDCEKYNEAALRGWIVLRVTPRALNTLETLAMVARALDIRRSA